MRVFGVMACVVVLAAGLAGCAGGGRVSEQLAEPTSLRDNKQAIALLRLAPLDPTCLTMGVQLGVREGQFYRVVQTLRLTQIAVTTVAEALLDPGEYYIVGFACFRARSTLVLSDKQGDGTLRRSYAKFSVAAGEVVNLGQIRVVPAGRTTGVVSPFHNATIEIADWPLAELERFKSQRPKHFAQMRVRLMTVDTGSVSTVEGLAQKCAALKQLQADGKLQNLPAECLSPPAAVKPPAGTRDQKA